ncbi:GNAT family N-acetyltransferase [Curtobacterium flaccumfaciens]|uniref:GNAT family N-acetyltransferase n=1 Tax=Curtobacterium flaccumfaciens TaxID=2035 RepID=UPI00344602FD
MSSWSLRFGVPTDAAELLQLERTYFPAVAGQTHAGYLFADPELSKLTLTEHLAAPVRSFTIVAEDDGKVVGFAMAAPWSFPGTGELDPSDMVLQYVAVDSEHRRQGIASALIAEITARATSARQNALVAHIPEASADFYRSIGWEVLSPQRGFAWVPFQAHLRADVADPELGYPLMASKVLRPRAIRTTFGFPVVSGRPTFDAATTLLALVESGEIDTRDLDDETNSMIDMARMGTPPESVLRFFENMGRRSRNS